MTSFLQGAAKALVAGLVAGGATLAVYLGVDPQLVGILGTILGPLAVYIVPNS